MAFSRDTKSINAKIPDELELEMREYTKRKGDVSRIVAEGLRLWLDKQRSDLATEHANMADLSKKVLEATYAASSNSSQLSSQMSSS